MAFTFKPAIYRDSVLYELPRPVNVLRIRNAWDFERFKVPLADGDFTAGHSRQGIGLVLAGQVGTQAGTLKASEQEMLDTIEELRDALHVAGSFGKYELFLYHDSGTDDYRKFKSCSTVRFTFDLSDKTIFGYTLTIHAEDPTMYNTAPGV